MIGMNRGLWWWNNPLVVFSLGACIPDIGTTVLLVVKEISMVEGDLVHCIGSNRTCWKAKRWRNRNYSTWLT